MFHVKHNMFHKRSPNPQSARWLPAWTSETGLGCLAHLEGGRGRARGCHTAGPFALLGVQLSSTDRTAARTPRGVRTVNRHAPPATRTV